MSIERQSALKYRRPMLALPRFLMPARLLIDDFEISPTRSSPWPAVLQQLDCPDCGHQSSRVYSRYKRRLLDHLLMVALFS
jgi:hypothetical protein